MSTHLPLDVKFKEVQQPLLLRLLEIFLNFNPYTFVRTKSFSISNPTNEFNSLFPRFPPSRTFPVWGGPERRYPHRLQWKEGGWKGPFGVEVVRVRWSALRWFKTLERPPRPRVPFATAAPGPCKKGGGGVHAAKNSFARKCGEKREREREIDGGIERGKEAVNEDAKARSARAQK